jgi:hypothetical protein
MPGHVRHNVLAHGMADRTAVVPEAPADTTHENNRAKLDHRNGLDDLTVVAD